MVRYDHDTFFPTKKDTQSTGFGLSMINDILIAHGGTLELESQPGEAVFTFLLNR